jgi:hypothetical protein
MATKSVIEIELIDDQFKAFSAQLKAMQAIIGSMPDQWKAVTKSVNEEQRAEAKAANEAEKARKKRIQEEKEFNRVIEDRKKAFMDAAYFTGNIAKNLASGALSIAKWTAFAAIGGGFGLGGLASNASDYRRRAQGLGVSTGGLRAAEVNLGRYMDIGGFLGNVAELQHDITQQYKLTRLGGTKTGNPIDQLQTVITNAINDFKSHGQDVNYAKAVGLDKLLPLEDLIRLSSLSSQELQATWKQLGEDRKKFEIDDRVSKKWQDFWTQLGRAGQDIQVLLIDKLQGLVEPLTRLSAVILDVIANFLKNNDVAKWIQGFGDSIKQFGDYLSTPEFKQDIEDFVTNIGALAEGLANIMRKLGIVPEKTYRTTQADISAVQLARPELNEGDATKVAKGINERRRNAIDRWVSAGVPLPVAVGMAANVEAESSWNIAAKNPGHYGLAQWDESRQKDFLAWKGHSLQTSTEAEQLDFILYEMNNKEKKTWDEISRAYANKGNYQDYTRIIGQHYERFGNDPKEYARRENIANRIATNAHIQVTINNTTDTNVAVKGLTNK